VRATLPELALDGSVNVSFPRGLAALVGFGDERYATLDVGTNSVKFIVGERDADGAWRTVVDRAEITRLGEGLAEDGRLGRAPIERTTDAVAHMVAEAREKGVLAIAAVGTAGLRVASNAADLVDAVSERCGVVVEVISGEEEARIAYRAARSVVASTSGTVAVFDTGGGSSQFTFGRGGEIEEQFSVDVGAARLTERFGLDGTVSEDALSETRAGIAAELDRLEERQKPAALVGMGGAVTNLAAVKHELSSYGPEIVHGTVLHASEIDRQIELYRSRTAEQRRTIAGLQPKRAELILAGACIVRTVLDELECDSLIVSDRGLRHGLLLEKFSSRSRSDLDGPTDTQEIKGVRR
jgi:exopolyphosphatase/guanosine-5'-triphosphate,3'-diphosphate pyrophosphatase